MRSIGRTDVRRGEVWTVSAPGSVAGKPRPAVIVQSDLFSESAAVIICAFTTDPADAPLARLLIAPSASNGLKAPSRLMLDRMTAILRNKLGTQLGALDGSDMTRLNRGLAIMLGLA